MKVCQAEYRICAGDGSPSLCLRAALALIIVAAGLISARQVIAATITVNTLNDSSGGGGCSLRDAITVANGTAVPGSGCPGPSADPSDEIVFSVVGTIALTGTLPEIMGHLSINPGAAAPRIAIDGRDKFLIMTIASGAVASINNLHLTHGTAPFISSHAAGGIDNAGALTIRHSALSHNSSGALGFAGAAIRNQVGATLTVITSAFVENKTTVASAGGIFNAGSLTVEGCGFLRNEGSNGGAGGIQNDHGGTATVSHSTFSGNTGRAGPGAISNRGNLTITASTFDRNTALATSGGIFNRSGSLSITNCTFAGNAGGGFQQPEAGGAIYNTATLTVTNSTFSGNLTDTQSRTNGGAILNRGSAAIRGSILAASHRDPNCGGSITDLGYNISDDDSCAFSATGSKNKTDPGLAADLARNGGPTDTIALQPGSPAVDAIPLDSCTDQGTPPKQLTTDQRGEPRPDPEDGPQGPCDIGAFELAESAACAGARKCSAPMAPRQRIGL